MHDGYRLVLDGPEGRRGQGDQALSNTPVYCHLKLLKLKGSSTTLLEINYAFFMAYSGPYNIAGKLKGAHDGDWEHMTVRCDMRGRLIAVYYSAHRYPDGTWVPAHNCPIDRETNRLIGFVSLNGHGIYPTTGVQPRVFLAANDITSMAGRRWASRECIVLDKPGGELTKGLTLSKLPRREIDKPKFTEPWDGPYRQYMGRLQERLLPEDRTGPPDDAPVRAEDIQVRIPGTVWMTWQVRWGTVNTPKEQAWFKDIEHPTGSYPLKRTLVPCVR
jgi:Vacuolar protein sorting-associated protein 62